MFPLPLLAAFLVVAPPSAAQSGAPLEQARAAFESAAPVTPELRQAVARSADGDPLKATLDEIAALEAGAPAANAIDEKALDDLARRVNKVSDALKVDGETRRAAVLNLYVARWQNGRAGLTPAQAAAQRKFAQARLETAMNAQSGAQARVTARLHDLDAFTSNAAGSVGPDAAKVAAAGAPANGAAGRSLINSAGRAQGLHVGDVPSPAQAAATTTAGAACTKDGIIATAFNLEKCSMKGTPNRESAEGTKATICSYLKKADYNPAAAYDLALAARRRSDADPGDLDLRNTEHYLYAYVSASNPTTLGDSAPVQVILAIGWTPFKTLTKYVRPTSTPSMEELEWGVKGAVNGVSRPDWRGESGGSLPHTTSV
jgi:hypothetical protein